MMGNEVLVLLISTSSTAKNPADGRVVDWVNWCADMQRAVRERSLKGNTSAHQQVAAVATRDVDAETKTPALSNRDARLVGHTGSFILKTKRIPSAFPSS